MGAKVTVPRFYYYNFTFIFKVTSFAILCIKSFIFPLLQMYVLLYQVSTDKPDRTLEVNADVTSDVYTFKLIIEDRMSVPASRQRLYVSGVHLEDQRTLRDYGVTSETHVSVYLADDDGTKWRRKRPRKPDTQVEVGGLHAL